MENPLRSEDAAFKLVLVVAVALGLVALGAWASAWLSLAIALLEAGALTWWMVFRGRTPDPDPTSPSASVPGEHRIVVLAGEDVSGPELTAALGERASGRKTRVVVVVPKPAGALAEWTGDAGDAPAEAEQRLGSILASLRAAGIDADGRIGEIDAAQAVEDALRWFAPDELVIASRPGVDGPWGDAGPVAWARERFDLPVSQVEIHGDPGG